MRDFPCFAALSPLDRALRRYDGFRGATWGALGGTSLALLLALATRYLPLWPRAVLLPRLALLWLLCILGGAGWVAFRPIAPAHRLRRLEQLLGLAERLTTAWELHTGDITATPTMQTAQLAETIQTLQAIEPRQAFALRPPKYAWWLISLLFLGLLGIFLLPNPQELVLAQRAARQQAAAREAAHLETLAETIRQMPSLPAAEREALLQALETAQQTLLDPTASGEAQQAALLEAEQQLMAAQASRSMPEVLRTAPLTSPDARATAFLDALQRHDPATAAALLDEINATAPLSPTALAELAEPLAQLAEASRSADPDFAAAVEAAANALANGDANAAAEALASAAAQDAAAQATLAIVQAGLQSSRERLSAAQRQAAGQASAGAASRSGQEGGQGSALHSEDSGSAAPYGPHLYPRLEEVGGTITLPRSHPLDGASLPGSGTETPARVPYRAVYAAYAQTATTALAQQPLPPGLRAAIHTYFSALAPEDDSVAP